MKLRETVPYGYRVFGHVMTAQAVDAYNATQLRINKFIEAGLPIPEYELHDSWARIAAYQSMT
jgi:hypothetical protein